MIKDDGITHINIYSRGKTDLGRMLSNFCYSKIDTVDGQFYSIEGYWYWLKCSHPDKNILKSLYGFNAKKVGRELGCDDWSNDFLFKTKIIAAILNKLIKNNDLLTLFENNKLPFKHYYHYSGKIVEPIEGLWLVNLFEYLRDIK